MDVFRDGAVAADKICDACFDEAREALVASADCPDWLSKDGDGDVITRDGPGNAAWKRAFPRATCFVVSYVEDVFTSTVVVRLCAKHLAQHLAQVVEALKQKETKNGE